jgi:acetylornithine deacetylase
MMDVVALAAELISIPSTTGQEHAVVDFVARMLIGQGWNVTVQEVSGGRSNVWAARTGGGVTLSTHLDTVPPSLSPRLDGDRLYGRGACDAKGIAAAMIVAAQALATAGESRVDLLFVVGEERSSDGAVAANLLPATSRFLINGEPTESRIASGAKGSLRVTLRTHGREAHSAYPHLGRSAITPMLEVLSGLQTLDLPADPVLGGPTINIGILHGGTAANIIPGAAEAELMVRVVGDVAAVKETIERRVAGRAEIEYGSFIPPQFFHTVPGIEAGPVAYTSDIPLLSRWGTPLMFGPGSIHVAHTPDEYVAIPELRAAVGTYERLVRTLLTD